MYYQSYEDYLRDLDYYRQVPTYDNYYMQYQRKSMQAENVEKLYPEVYSLIYPMVNRACNQHVGGITEDVINRISNDIYSKLEIKDVEKEVRVEVKNSRSEAETRQCRPNNLLKDLVKILVIRELLGRRPNRPPYPGRPPFPGGPMVPRPPMPPPMPRDIDYYNNEY